MKDINENLKGVWIHSKGLDNHLKHIHKDHHGV